MSLSCLSRSAVALGQVHVDEPLGVQAFDVGEHQQLFEGGVFAHVAFQRGVGVAPLFGGQAEEGDVEYVGLAGIGDGGLRGCDGGRYQVRFDGVGVDAVVELGQGAIQIQASDRRRFSSSLGRRWNSLMR